MTPRIAITSLTLLFLAVLAVFVTIQIAPGRSLAGFQPIPLPTDTPQPGASCQMPDAGNIPGGDPVGVPLTCHDIPPPGLGSYIIDVNFDPTAVSYDACEANLSPTPQYQSCAPLDSDTVEFEGYVVNSPLSEGATILGAPPTGTVVLGSITFTCLTNGLTALSISVQQLTDSSDGDLGTASTDGSINCVGDAPTATPTDTPEPIPTNTPGPSPTDTATATPTATATGAATATPTATAIPSTATLTATAAPPTATLAATATLAIPTITPTPQPPIGDVDCNGRVDAIDASLVLQFVAGLIDTLPCKVSADADDDGDVTALDALAILQYVAGLVQELPV